MDPRKAEAVIFDWDGVLFDSTLAHRNIKADLELVFPHAATVHNSKGRSTEDFLREQLHCSGGLEKEEIDVVIKQYLDAWYDLENRYGLKVFSGANELLSLLKEKHIMRGVISNRGPERHNFKIFKNSDLALGLLDFFVIHMDKALPSLEMDHESCSYDLYSGRAYCQTPFSKPDPLALSPVRQMLSGLPDYPRSVYYVGDNLIDLEFSRNNDFKFIGVLSGEISYRNAWLSAGLDESRGDMIVKDIGELLQIF